MKNSSEISNLDFLRSWAITLVVISHLCWFWGSPSLFGKFAWNQIGHLGVILFFVHTSLVLMLSLDRQASTFGVKNLVRRFYLRRMMRVYPLSILAVLAIYLLALPVGRLSEYVMPAAPPMDPFQIAANLGLWQNFLKNGEILDPLWSLPYEIQMYLALPFIYHFAKKKWAYHSLIIAWAGLSLMAVISVPTIEAFNNTAEYWNIPQFLLFVPCFLPGIIAYTQMTKPNPFRSVPFLALPILLSFLTLGFIFSDNPIKYVFASFICGSSLPFIREMKAPALKKIFKVVATYSYGAYVGHYFCMRLAFVEFAFLPVSSRWLIFGFSLTCLSVVLYHCIEKPGIMIGRGLANRLWGSGSPDGATKNESTQVSKSA